MAETMHSFKPYPNDRQVGKAAEALVTAHPCLREHGSESGWYWVEGLLEVRDGELPYQAGQIWVCGGVRQCRQEEPKQP